MIPSQYIILIHNSVLWDREYFEEYSHIHTEYERIFLRLPSVPESTVMDLNNWDLEFDSNTKLGPGTWKP